MTELRHAMTAYDALYAALAETLGVRIEDLFAAEE